MSQNTDDTSEPQRLKQIMEKQLRLPVELASNLKLIHRVLMADPSEYAHLTLSGDEPMLSTPSFEEFKILIKNETSDQQDRLQRQLQLEMGVAVKKALRDELCEQMQNSQSIKPACDLLIELHENLRSLIPSRQDLHGLLNDDAVRSADSRENLLHFCIMAAKALSLLESEARSETTLDWISLAHRSSHNLLQKKENFDIFLATSILYLLFKAELCAKDKHNFYFSHFWVPELVHLGPDIIRRAFEKQYGVISDPSTAPATRQWLRSIDTSTNQWSDKDLIKKAWVHDIVLRGKGSGTMPLPEIFSLDQGSLRTIRMKVRIAVAGSALGIYACKAAGQSTDVLEQNIEPYSQLDTRRRMLVQVMGERFKDENTYQTSIADAVVDLARYWQPNLDESSESQLRSRTVRVLAADDSVVELLDSRMKMCFTELLTSSIPTTAPAELRSGRSNATSQDSASSPSLPSRKSTFLKHATSLFCSKGLSLFSSDLALMAWTTLRVVEVAILLYYDKLMEPSLRGTRSAV